MKTFKKGIAVVLSFCMVVGMASNDLGSSKVEAGNTESVTEKEGYANWTFSTVGLIEDKYTVTNTQVYAGGDVSLGSSAFSGYVSFDQATDVGVALTAGGCTAPRLTLGSVESQGFWECDGKIVKFGLRTYTDGKYYLSCGVGNTSGQYNWNFMADDIELNEEILLQVAFDYVDADADGTSDDLQLHIWVNGTKVSSALETWDNWNTVTGDDLIVTDYVDETAVMRIYASLWGTPGTGTVCARSANLVEPEKEYNEWTFSTVGFADDVITATGEQLYKGGDLSLEESAFKGYVTFDQATTEVGTCLTSGGCTAPRLTLGSVRGMDFWDCDSQIIKFGLRVYTDSKYYLSCGVGSSDWIFLDDDVELNEEIYLKVAFEYVDADEDGASDDLQLYVWVNGTAVSVAQQTWGDWVTVTGDDLIVTDYVDETAPMRIYAALWGAPGTGTVTARSAEVAVTPTTIEKSDITYDLADGSSGYVLIGEGTICVDGVEVAAGETLSTVGSYEVECEGNNVIYKRTVHIIDSRSDLAQIPALSYDILGGDEVMPIIGHYIPHEKSYSTDDGGEQAINFTKDRYYELAKECGINLIAYTETDASSNQTAVLEQLRLAEKYNMGMFVQNSSLWTMQESEYWDVLGAYNYYDSFLGINVIDEPGISGLYGGADHITAAQDGAYASTSKIVNKYANLTGYVNLLPMLDKLNLTTNDISTAYRTYIQQASVDAGSKVISYDRYISEYDWSQDEDGNYILVNSADFYKNLSDIRYVAGQSSIPFWTYIETGDYSDAEDTYRQIEREEILWYVNTALAYGTKGVQYYSVVETDTSTDVGNDGAAEHGLIDCQGNKTKWYGYVQEANRQIAAVDNVLMKSISQGVVVAGEDSYVANHVSGLPEYISDSSVYNLKSVTTDDSVYGALTGVFHYYPDHTGTGYNTFYVVNSNPTAEQKITLTFNGAVAHSVVQNAEVTYMNAADTCEVTIPAGEGALVVTGVDLTRTSNDAVVVYYDEISEYRYDEVLGVKDYRAPELQDESYQNWTFRQVFQSSGIPLSSGQYSSYASGKVYLDGNGITLDGSRFNGYVSFGDTSESPARDYTAPRLMFGAVKDNVWTNQTIRFGLQTVNGSTYLACGTVGLEGEEANGTSHIFTGQTVDVGSEILLQVTFDYVDHDEDGANDDLRMGVWIDENAVTSVNGETVATNYIYVNNHATSADEQQAYMTFHVGEKSVTVRSADATKEHQNYVFAGWYQEQACLFPIDEETVSGSAYAKFVDADILDVCVQLNSDETAIRYVSTVDSLEYQKIGFDIRLDTTEQNIRDVEVYGTIYQVSDTTVMDETPSVCSDFSKYFFAYTINDIPDDEEERNKPLIVTPNWLTLDGTEVCGKTVSHTVGEAVQLD